MRVFPRFLFSLFPTIFLFQIISTYILFIQSKLPPSLPSVSFHSTPLLLLYFLILSPHLLQFFSINAHQQPHHHLLPSTFPDIVSFLFTPNSSLNKLLRWLNSMQLSQTSVAQKLFSQLPSKPILSCTTYTSSYLFQINLPTSSFSWPSFHIFFITIQTSAPCCLSQVFSHTDLRV